MISAQTAAQTSSRKERKVLIIRSTGNTFKLQFVNDLKKSVIDKAELFPPPQKIIKNLLS